MPNPRELVLEFVPRASGNFSQPGGFFSWMGGSFGLPEFSELLEVLNDAQWRVFCWAVVQPQDGDGH